MHDFYCFFPRGESDAGLELLTLATHKYHKVFPEVGMRQVDDDGGHARMVEADNVAAVWTHQESKGWIALKGTVCDTANASGETDAKTVFRHLTGSDSPDLNRFEGAFSLALWDVDRVRALLLNDQLSVMHLYYAETDLGLFATTRPLPLAVALRMRLDPMAVCEFLARGQVIPPTVLFSGMRQLSLGQHAVWNRQRCSIHQHWRPYAEIRQRSLRAAVSECAALVKDRMLRLCGWNQPVVCDLTAGFDSRLVLAGCESARVRFGVTTNGRPEAQDVMTARTICTNRGYRWEHFAPDEHQNMIDETTARQLLYRTNGELILTACLSHLRTRPLLRTSYALHLKGGGGETFRSFPWGQEFLGIGRRRLASVSRAIAYRFLQGGRPPVGLFQHDWYSPFKKLLTSRVEDMCLGMPNSLTTQQLDAVHLWKNQGHGGAYTSSLYDLMPTLTPLATGGIQGLVAGVPWTFKVNARLLRGVMAACSPELARFRTQYGGDAAPTSLRNLHLEFAQMLRNAGYLIDKLKRVRASRKGRVNRGEVVEGVKLEREKALVRRVLRPAGMLSINFYQEQSLQNLMSMDDDRWNHTGRLLLRLATLELLFQELSFCPELRFLAPA